LDLTSTHARNPSLPTGEDLPHACALVSVAAQVLAPAPWYLVLGPGAWALSGARHNPGPRCLVLAPAPGYLGLGLGLALVLLLLLLLALVVGQGAF